MGNDQAMVWENEGLNCPACEKEVKVLLDKPDNSFYATTTVDLGTAGDGAGTLINDTTPIKEVYKCCNEECWVTRIEVDWGQS